VARKTRYVVASPGTFASAPGTEEDPLTRPETDPTAADRIEGQLRFIAELDRLKLVERRTSVIGESRLENSAEHSWHLALMAPLLAEYAVHPVDLDRTMRMLLVHDVVEIDAGDTFAFDETANLDKEERERRAADRLFGLLPTDQGGELRTLWDEFEARESPEALFANALDRFQGLIQNYHNDGGTWLEYEVPVEKILERMDPIREGAPGLWPFALRVLREVMGGEAAP
jgi:5'-deoxynucleotidase YfbR-like HD superfamily hydrolase